MQDHDMVVTGMMRHNPKLGRGKLQHRPQTPIRLIYKVGLVDGTPQSFAACVGCQVAVMLLVRDAARCSMLQEPHDPACSVQVIVI